MCCRREHSRIHSLACIPLLPLLGFPGSSAGKESTRNAGDPGLIPGSGRSVGEGIGNPLQYSCASLVVQLVKESTCNVGDLGSIPGLGRSLGEGNGYPLRIPDWEIPQTENAGRLQSIGLQRVGHNWAMNTVTSLLTFSITGSFPLLTVISFSALHFSVEGIIALFWHFWNNGRHFECKSNSNGIKKNYQQVRFLVWVLKTNEMLYYSVFCLREFVIFFFS